MRGGISAPPPGAAHFTAPTSASWLNVVERFFAVWTNKQIRRGTFTSVSQMEQTLINFLDRHNQNPKPLVRTAGADEILSRVERFCERTKNPGH